MSDKKDRAYLLEKIQCDGLLNDTSIRMNLVRSHINEHSSFDKKSSAEVLRLLCELYVSLDGLAALLKIARSGPIQEHDGIEHYVITEPEGFVIQSIYLPAILELKDRVGDFGLSLTIN